MGTPKNTLSASPFDDGQGKGKPQKFLSPGVIQRLSLQQPLDVAIARTTVHKLAGELGYSLINQARISTAVFEIADNIVTYAGQGEIVISWRETAEHKGLHFFCNDQGHHTPQLTRLYATNGSNGKKLVDEFKFTEDSELGNCIIMSIWID